MSPSLKRLCVTTCLIISSVAHAENAPNAEQIMQQARDRHDGHSFISQVSLILHDKQGNSRR